MQIFKWSNGTLVLEKKYDLEKVNLLFFHI